ncbi:DUF4115 domain-containing protein [Streptomyces sp. NBC_00249]|uniref:RodZ domain-containing protein n=1 Tax=Streptomyces sp. NBC_00249 TaxID=2975690 RepID=UPI002258AA9B|nr:RodZ domain-containing protein [Streptomyces sp. NBC_00249]MCX5198502.1 DUF4115 domain-containing protein [Streptomyces sp. NBC_00249]
MRFGADLPERIGSYAVERELGAGGMGTVYLARSRGGRAVAVKVVRPELAADRHFRERFRAEVDAARKVGGFHTAPVVDADPDADVPWLATAYIPGPTLSGLLAERGPMDEERLRRLGAALTEALQAVHACGLVHRDLKPGNIIMAEDGPRVLDFGIARAVESTRLTSTGSAFGTPGFLAPEQAQGLDVTGAADVFALGAVLVAAAGGSAFGEGTPLGLMYRSVHEPADVSAVPEPLRATVEACLAKSPSSRPLPSTLLDLFAPAPAAPEPTQAAPAGPLPGAGPRTPAPQTPAGLDGAAPAPAGPLPGASPRTPAPQTPEGLDGAAPVPVADPRIPAPQTPARLDGAAPVDMTAPVDVAASVGLAGGAGRAKVLRGAVAAVVLGAVIATVVIIADKGDGQDRGAASPPASSSPSASRPGASPDPGRSGPDAATPPRDPARSQATVQVDAQGSSWISAKDSKGKLLFDGTIASGESKTFTDDERIDLVLGDASAVRLVVNGKRIHDVFQPGQVERLTYTRAD